MYSTFLHIFSTPLSRLPLVPFLPSLSSTRFPLYVDSTYSPARWHNSESFATDLPDYEETLTATSRAQSDSETNLLSVRQDEDDRVSGDSTNFATPEAGLTPKSSDEEGEGRLKVGNTPTTLEDPSTYRLSPRKDVVRNWSTSPASKAAAEGVAEQHLLVAGVPSLEQSGDSATLLHSESGSQCTLTESKESGKLLATPPVGTNGSTQVQVNNTDRTGLENHRPESALNGGEVFSSQNGVDVDEGVDGAVQSSSSKKQHYPDMPPHLLSINSSGWQGVQDIVTFEPQWNGLDVSRQSGSAHASTPTSDLSTEVKGGARSEPVAAACRDEVTGNEESFSAGSGCYKDVLLKGGVVPEVGVAVEQTNVVRAGADSPLVFLPATTATVGRVPVSSVGTSDELPLLFGGGEAKAEERQSKNGVGSGWVAKKVKDSMHPPADLQLMREQVSPDVYHTPITSE